jgi:hypothetical protein
LAVALVSVWSRSADPAFSSVSRACCSASAASSSAWRGFLRGRSGRFLSLVGQLARFGQAVRRLRHQLLRVLLRGLGLVLRALCVRRCLLLDRPQLGVGLGASLGPLALDHLVSGAANFGGALVDPARELLLRLRDVRASALADLLGVIRLLLGLPRRSKRLLLGLLRPLGRRLRALQASVDGVAPDRGGVHDRRLDLPRAVARVSHGRLGRRPCAFRGLECLRQKPRCVGRQLLQTSPASVHEPPHRMRACHLKSPLPARRFWGAATPENAAKLASCRRSNAP